RVLQKMDEIQQMMETEYSDWVVKTLSLVQVVKDSNQKLNENNPSMYKVPETSESLSQTLFVFNNSNPVDRRRIVSDDYQRAHITVNLRNGGTHEYTAVFANLQSDIEKIMQPLQQEYPQMMVSVTGLFALMMQG